MYSPGRLAAAFLSRSISVSKVENLLPLLYSQPWPRRVQFLQKGLLLSHLTLRLRHFKHATFRNAMVPDRRGGCPGMATVFGELARVELSSFILCTPSKLIESIS